ncbi:AbrB/MazE/SpoVT family DNA-binding domain-containing protein [Glaciimonas sp. GG7]
MELLIQKWGDSAAVCLPAELLSQLKVVPGDKLSVDIRPEGVLLKSKRPAYALADLIAQCDQSASVPDDVASWNRIRPVGRETGC